MKRSFCLAAAAGALVLLSACATVGTGEEGAVVAPQARKGGFMGLATEADVKSEYDRAFKDVRRVVIGGFKVGFNESKELVDKRGGGLFSGPAKTATGQVKLVGVDDHNRQKITDEIYENFIALLKEKGYEIVDRNELTSSPLYAKVKEVEFPLQDDQSGFFSSYGISHYHSPSAIGPRQPMFEGEANDGPFAGLANMAITQLTSNYAKESDARIINVAYAVDFAAAADQRGFVKHALELGQAMAVNSGQLGITGGSTGVYAHRMGKLTLGQPVASELPFATIVDETSDGAVAAQVTTNILTGFLQGGLIGAAANSQNQTRQYVFETTNEKYEAAALDALNKANIRLVETMASLRD